MKTPTFTILDHALLLGVAGGAARITSASSAGTKEVTRLLTEVTDSIKDLARNGQQQTDPSMMMMMMMLVMGGLGGGGGGGAPAAMPAPPPIPPPIPPTSIVSIQNHVGR
jgi:hypothetical protein